MIKYSICKIEVGIFMEYFEISFNLGPHKRKGSGIVDPTPLILVSNGKGKEKK